MKDKNPQCSRSNSILHVENLCFKHGSRTILHDLSLALKEGESVSLIGTSGSGKTTLFKILTGLLALQHGTVAINNLPLSKGKKHITYMMQDTLLLPWRSVRRNITLVNELGPEPSSSFINDKVADDVLAKLGISEYADMLPMELSGGLKQRVALARALTQQRPLLLLDEPFNSLDVSTREQLYALLRKVQKEFQLTTLMVTHDFHDALALSDRILCLGRGSIVKSWIITPEIRQDPLATALLLNEMRAALRESFES